MKEIEVDFSIVRNGELIYEGYSNVGFTDKNIKEIAAFIQDGHYSGELVDVPSHVYDRIVTAVTNTAIQDMKKEMKDVLLESDDVVLQEVLPAGLLEFLPEEIISMIDTEKIGKYYDYDIESEDDSLDIDDSQTFSLIDMKEYQEEEDFHEVEHVYMTDEELALEGPEWEITPEDKEDPTKDNTLYLTIKQKDFDLIIAGKKRVEVREIKDTTYKKYLDVAENGNLYYDIECVYDQEGIDKYDIYVWNKGVYPYYPKNIQYLDLAVGYNKNRDTAKVEVIGYSFKPQFLKTNVIGRLSEGSDGKLKIASNGDQCFWTIVFHLGKVELIQKK